MSITKLVHTIDRDIQAFVEIFIFQDGIVEPEAFTERLQTELKSSPQPYLVPFLKVNRKHLNLTI